MAEYLNREQSAADGSNHRVNGIPCRVDPRNLVGEKLEKIEDAGDCNDCRVAEDLERLIGRRERDPVEMDSQSSDENREIKVDAGQASQTERDHKEVKLLHAENIGASESLSRASSSPDQMTHVEARRND